MSTCSGSLAGKSVRPTRFGSSGPRVLAPPELLTHAGTVITEIKAGQALSFEVGENSSHAANNMDADSAFVVQAKLTHGRCADNRLIGTDRATRDQGGARPRRTVVRRGGTRR